MGSLACLMSVGSSPLTGLTRRLSYYRYSFTGLDKETFKACPSVPCASSFPNAYRWYLHIAALSGIKT